MTDPLHIESCAACGEPINIRHPLGWAHSKETGRYWHTGCIAGQFSEPIHKTAQPQTD